eukprot:ctg_2207.g431
MTPPTAAVAPLVLVRIPVPRPGTSDHGSCPPIESAAAERTKMPAATPRRGTGTEGDRRPVDRATTAMAPPPARVVHFRGRAQYGVHPTPERAGMGVALASGAGGEAAREAVPVAGHGARAGAAPVSRGGGVSGGQGRCRLLHRRCAGVDGAVYDTAVERGRVGGDVLCLRASAARGGTAESGENHNGRPQRGDGVRCKPRGPAVQARRPVQVLAGRTRAGATSRRRCAGEREIDVAEEREGEEAMGSESETSVSVSEEGSASSAGSASDSEKESEER